MNFEREKNVRDSCCNNFLLVIVGFCEAVVIDLFLLICVVCVWSISFFWGIDKGIERYFENGLYKRRGLYILFDELNICINCKR